MAKCVPLPINNKLDQYVHRSATSECNSILSHTHVFVHLSLCLFLTDTTDSLTFPGSIVTRINTWKYAQIKCSTILYLPLPEESDDNTRREAQIDC